MSIANDSDFIRDRFNSDIKMSEGKMADIIEGVKKNLPNHEIDFNPKGNRKQIKVDGVLVDINVNFSHLYTLHKQNIDVTEEFIDLLTSIIKQKLKNIDNG